MTVVATKRWTDVAGLPILSINDRIMVVGPSLKPCEGTGMEIHPTVKIAIVMEFFSFNPCVGYSIVVRALGLQFSKRSFRIKFLRN